jgi:hypothetical protein
MFEVDFVRALVFYSGLGQIALIIGSLAIPKLLRWNDVLKAVNPLTRQMFWVYSAYIWGTNLCFGLVSTFAPHLLVRNDVLATCVNGFIFVYWGARILIQFFYFDRSDTPEGAIYTLGEIALVILFAVLTFVYGLAGYTCYQLGVA